MIKGLLLTLVAFLAPLLLRSSSPQHADVGSRSREREVRERYLHLMEVALTGVLTDEMGSCRYATNCKLFDPFVLETRRAGIDWPPAGHTMVGLMRLQNVRNSIDTLLGTGIAGDFLELGVWRGGTAIYMRAYLDALGITDGSRKVILADVFGPMDSYGEADFLAVTLPEVKHNFDKYGVPMTHVEFVAGLFSNSLAPWLAARGKRPLALVRYDCNFYDSHMDALYATWELIPVGGILIFDDFRSHPWVEEAWADFSQDNGIAEETVNVPPPDIHGSWFFKTRDVKIDQRKRRPFKDSRKPK